jgi:LysR family glycine cleavage system transcriptional activator
MASPAFLERHPLKHPADILEVPRLSPNDEWWDTWFASLSDVGYSGAQEPSLRFDAQVLDGNAAVAGHGVAMIFPPMFAQAIEAGLLVAPFDHYAIEPRPMWLVPPQAA